MTTMWTLNSGGISLDGQLFRLRAHRYTDQGTRSARQKRRPLPEGLDYRLYIQQPWKLQLAGGGSCDTPLRSYCPASPLLRWAVSGQSGFAVIGPSVAARDPISTLFATWRPSSGRRVF